MLAPSSSGWDLPSIAGGALSVHFDLNSYALQVFSEVCPGYDFFRVPGFK
jgi:hypothetical protein